MSETDLSTADTLRGRVHKNRYLFWLLVGANRWLVVGLLALVTFGAFMLFGLVKDTPLLTIMEDSDMVETVFSGLVGAIITSTTLVVSINQLVLSQEIESLGNQRDRMEVTMDYYQNLDELLGRTKPAEPATLIRALLDANVERASALQATVSDNDNDELRRRVDRYVEDLVDNADQAKTHLDDAEFGDFDVLSSALDFNYSRKMHDIRRLGERYEGELDSEEWQAFREMLEAVTMFGPIREYVKVLYLQWALVKLSRAILYASVPAIIVAGGITVFVDATTFPGRFLGVETMLWVVSAGFTVSVLPFLVFMAFIVRLATLAKQTLTVGPLVLS